MLERGKIETEAATFLEAAAALESPGCAVLACFQNLETVADIVGPAVVSDLRASAHRELSRVGDTTVIATESGPVYATVAPGELNDVLERLRSVSWVAHVFVGVTEAWRLRSAGEWLESLVPRRLLELSAGLRFGVVPLTSDPAANLETAAGSAAKQVSDTRGITRFGFPALWPNRFRTLTQIADPQCPACAAAKPQVIDRKEANEGDSDRTFSIERCSSCALIYERHRVWMVGGRDVGSCALMSEDAL